MPPLCLDIETAAICDLACPFCFREFTVTPDKIIDENFCYNLINQASELKIPSIKFNWRGEPLLHPKLPNFIEHAKKNVINHFNKIQEKESFLLITKQKAKQLISKKINTDVYFKVSQSVCFFLCFSCAFLCFCCAF